MGRTGVRGTVRIPLAVYLGATELKGATLADMRTTCLDRFPRKLANARAVEGIVMSRETRALRGHSSRRLFLLPPSDDLFACLPLPSFRAQGSGLGTGPLPRRPFPQSLALLLFPYLCARPDRTVAEAEAARD